MRSPGLTPPSTWAIELSSIPTRTQRSSTAPSGPSTRRSLHPSALASLRAELGTVVAALTSFSTTLT